MPGTNVNFSVLNQLATPILYADTLVNRPAASIIGRIFFRTDSPYGLYRDNGTSWDLMANVDTNTVTGGGATGQVTFFSAASVIAGNNNLFWDNTNSRLGINTTTPGVPLDIHGTGTNVQFNGTGTNNAFAVFQNAGTSKWRIGNNYSGATNYFSIYDTVNSIETIKINSGVTNSFLLTANATINGTASMLNLNGLTTNDAFLNFQNAGTNEWRIGNNYSGATNYFSIYDISNSVETLKIASGATNTLTITGTTNITGVLNGTNTLTGITGATSGTLNAFNSNNTYNAGITRDGQNDINVNFAQNNVYSGALTWGNTGNRGNIFVNGLFTLNGNISQTAAGYILAYSNINTRWSPSGTGTFAQLSTVTMSPDFGGASVTVSNRYALLINNLSGFGTSPTYTNRWAIYQEGASDNVYFAGKVNIGTTTVGTNILNVNGTSLFSNTINIADAINIALQTTTGTKIGTSTTQKIGFWNVAPIVQPTTATTSAAFVVNAGTAINTLSTFDGYKIDQVVKALRNAGILA